MTPSQIEENDTDAGLIAEIIETQSTLHDLLKECATTQDVIDEALELLTDVWLIAGDDRDDLS